MNKNCFAYTNKRCRALDKMLCATGSCPFYKTAEEYENGIKKSYERINSMDSAAQESISDTYYKGRYPWLKEDDAYGC